jgi:hypothetical protein
MHVTFLDASEHQVVTYLKFKVQMQINVGCVMVQITVLEYTITNEGNKNDNKRTVKNFKFYLLTGTFNIIARVLILL